MEGVLEHEVVEIRFVGREEDDRILLLEPCDPLHHGFVVDESLVVAPGVEPADRLGDEIDHERAMGRRDLAQIARGLRREGREGREGRDRRERPAVRAADLALPPSLLQDAIQSAAKARPPEDLLVHQARHLVTRPSHPPLGALERERRLLPHELRESDRLGLVEAAGRRPALTQIRGEGRLAGDQQTAVRLPPRHDRLAQPVRISGIPRQQEAEEARLAGAISKRGEPDDPQRRHQRVAPGREGGRESGLEGGIRRVRIVTPARRSPPPGARDLHDFMGLGPPLFRPIRGDPGVDQAPLDAARRLDEKDDAPARPGRSGHSGPAIRDEGGWPRIPSF